MACTSTSNRPMDTEHLDAVMPRVVRVRELVPEDAEGVEAAERFGGYAVDIRYPDDGRVETTFVAVDVVWQDCCEQAGYDHDAPENVEGAWVLRPPRFAVGSERAHVYGEEILVDTSKGRITLRAWNEHEGFYPHDGIARLPGRPIEIFQF